MTVSRLQAHSVSSAKGATGPAGVDQPSLARDFFRSENAGEKTDLFACEMWVCL